MCGRFTLRTSAAELIKFFDLVGPLHELAVRWNVAPTQQVLAIRQDDKGREPAWLKWGLIPVWAKDAKIGNSLVNARAETITEKPSFRSAFKQRRCLVVADGYYEWKQVDKGKIPFLMTMQDNSPFAFAGIWERWKDPSGEAIETCSTVTTNPNSLVAVIHDRMPVILKPSDYNRWLDPTFHDTDELKAMLVPYPPEEMNVEEVSTVINNARNEVDPRIGK